MARGDAHLRHGRVLRIRKYVELLMRQRAKGSFAGPTYVVVGAKRCGTSSMHRYLIQHPDLLEPAVPKNVHFFDLHHDRGADWYARHFPSDAEHERHTAATGHPTATGESCPNYFFHPDVAARIHAAFPSMKVIVLMRNPAARAWSHYQYEVQRGTELREFGKAMAEDLANVSELNETERREARRTQASQQAHGYLLRGHYREQLLPFADVFPAEQLHIIRSEDMYADPVQAMRSTYRFLGLRDHELADPTIGKPNKPRSKPEAELQMLAEYYAPFNAALEEHLGRDLGWS